MREGFEAAIRELGYVPYPLEPGTNLVAMLIPDIYDPFYPELVRTAQRGREYLRQIRSKRLDGPDRWRVALHGMQDDLLEIAMPTVFDGNPPGGGVDAV